MQFQVLGDGGGDELEEPQELLMAVAPAVPGADPDVVYVQYRRGSIDSRETASPHAAPRE